MMRKAKPFTYYRRKMGRIRSQGCATLESALTKVCEDVMRGAAVPTRLSNHDGTIDIGEAELMVMANEILHGERVAA